MRLKVVLEPGEDGFFVVSVPALPGCVSQGRTKREAMENIKEAILLYLEPNPKDLRRKAHREIHNLAV